MVNDGKIAQIGEVILQYTSRQVKRANINGAELHQFLLQALLNTCMQDQTGIRVYRCAAGI